MYAHHFGFKIHFLKRILTNIINSNICKAFQNAAWIQGKLYCSYSPKGLYCGVFSSRGYTIYRGAFSSQGHTGVLILS